MTKKIGLFLCISGQLFLFFGALAFSFKGFGNTSFSEKANLMIDYSFFSFFIGLIFLIRAEQKEDQDLVDKPDW